MSLENDVKRLAATRPFSLLPREALQLLAFSCERRPVKAGQGVFAEGDEANEAFFVLSGEIALVSRGEERRAGTGVLIGETALVTEMPRGASAKAVSDSMLLCVTRATFRRVLEEFPHSAAKIHKSASLRARELLRRLEEARRKGFDV